jgi:hypothetical protein
MNYIDFNPGDHIVIYNKDNTLIKEGVIKNIIAKRFETYDFVFDDDSTCECSFWRYRDSMLVVHKHKFDTHLNQQMTKEYSDVVTVDLKLNGSELNNDTLNEIKEHLAKIHDLLGNVSENKSMQSFYGHKDLTLSDIENKLRENAFKEYNLSDKIKKNIENNF